MPVHKHNCDEQVTLIEGEAMVEIEGKMTSVSVRDTVSEAGTGTDLSTRAKAG